jgi:hypothetical protein
MIVELRAAVALTKRDCTSAVSLFFASKLGRCSRCAVASHGMHPVDESFDPAIESPAFTHILELCVWKATGRRSVPKAGEVLERPAIFVRGMRCPRVCNTGLSQMVSRLRRESLTSSTVIYNPHWHQNTEERRRRWYQEERRGEAPRKLEGAGPRERVTYHLCSQGIELQKWQTGSCTVILGWVGMPCAIGYCG